MLKSIETEEMEKAMPSIGMEGALTSVRDATENHTIFILQRDRTLHPREQANSDASAGGWKRGKKGWRWWRKRE